MSNNIILLLWYGIENVILSVMELENKNYIGIFWNGKERGIIGYPFFSCKNLAKMHFGKTL